MQFRLIANPPVKGAVLVLLFVAAAGEIAVLVVFLTTANVESALAVGLGVLAMAVMVPLSFWLMSLGVIELTEERLELRTVLDKRLIEWRDIATARVRTVSQLGRVDRIFARLARSSDSCPLVEIGLKRSFRLAILPWHRDGTDAIGLPALPSRRIRAYVSDPERLVDAIAEFLHNERA